MSHDLDEKLARVVQEIERIEKTRTRFGAVMRQVKQDIDISRFPAAAEGIATPEFVKRIDPVPLKGLTIAGIDGGLVRREFHSVDLVITRGVAVIFRFGFKDGPVVDFFPDPFPVPNVGYDTKPLSAIESEQMATLERVSTELRVALSVLEKFHTNIILMDGSLFFHPRDRPSSSSEAYEKFQEVLALYRQLYTKASKSECTLVGVVKDSRSTRVVNLLGDILPHLLRDPEMFELMRDIDYRGLLRHSRDCDILDTFLDEGERTIVFRYATELTQSHNALDDLLTWASSIWVTYIKTARDDLPLRVEVLARDDPSSIEVVDRTLAALLPLSSHHPEYGVPAPIVEADTRARITNREAQFVLDRLVVLAGPHYRPLEKRRSRNPFGG